MKSLRAALLFAAILPLAACGSTDETAAPDGSGPPSSPAQAAVKCEDLPKFVALMDGAKVSFCPSNSAEGKPHRSGTVTYSVAATPAQVIAFYKARAAAEGIPDSIANPDPGQGMGPMYSARDGTRRSFMAMTKPLDTQTTEVTLNWGEDR